MTTALSHYKYLSNQALSLPTELLQVGFFRNDQRQNSEIIKHNLSKQHYQLNELFCDTFVETPLFSMMLVEHQNFYLNGDNADNEEGIVLSFAQGSRLIKQLKLKGNYTLPVIEEKLITFKDKFVGADFCVDGESIKIFDSIFVNPDKKLLGYEFSEDFIAYLNERKHALTLIQNSDFVAVKGKTQVPSFLIIQSLKGIKDPFFTKRYIADILGLTGDVNKKLSVALGDLELKHAIEYVKEVCNIPSSGAQFSRFNIKNVDADFVSKMEQDKLQKVSKTTSTPEKSEANKQHEPEAQPTKITANKPISDTGANTDTKINNVVCFASFKQKQLAKEKTTAEEEALIDLDLDELDEAWCLAVSDENTVAYRTVNGALSFCGKSQIPSNVQVFTPEIISRSQIKRFNFQ